MALHGLMITHHTAPTLPTGGWQVRHLSPPVPLSRAQNLMPNGELECHRYMYHSRMSMLFALTNHLTTQCTCDDPDMAGICPSADNEVPLDPELPTPTFSQRVHAVAIAHIIDGQGSPTGQWIIVRRLAGRGPRNVQYLESVGLSSRWADAPVINTRSVALAKLAFLIRRETDFANKTITTGYLQQ